MFPTFPMTGNVEIAAPTDVKLLLHGNGANGSSTITDSSTYNRTPTGSSGTPTIDTSQSKFGGGSIRLNGYPAEDYFYYTSADFDLAADENWTVECWCRWNTVENRDHVFQFGKDVNNRLLVFIDTAGADNLVLGKFASGGSTLVETTYEISAGTWYHIAVMRKGSTIYFFVNGAVIGTMSTLYLNLISGTVRLDIGYQPYGAFFAANYLDGWIEEFRYITGAAVYPEGGFTPPIAAFPDP